MSTTSLQGNVFMSLIGKGSVTPQDGPEDSVIDPGGDIWLDRRA